MTIAIITSLYKPYARGGAEIVADIVIDELKKHHHVIVITTTAWKGWRSLIAHKTQEHGVDIYRYYPFNIFSFSSIEDNKPFFLRFIWHIFDTLNFHSFFTVRNIITKEKPDIVMTHNLKGIGYCIVFALRILRLFHIHTVHDVQLVVPSGVLMVGQDSTRAFHFSAGFFSFFHKAFFGSPSVVVFPSRFLKIFYERWNFFPKSKKIVHPNPVPPSVIGSSSIIDEIYNKRLRSFAAGHRTFLYFGLLKKQKGIFVLLDAFFALKSSNARLLICGSGKDEERLRRAASHDSRVSFLGYIERGDVWRVFADTHFVVIPSLLYENSPMVVYESFSSGIPVIGTESGGASELVSDQDNGFITESGNEQSLLRVLEHALCLDVKHYQRMCTSARARVADFTPQEYCDMLLEYFISQTRTQ